MIPWCVTPGVDRLLPLETHTWNIVQSSQKSKGVRKFLALNDISLKTLLEEHFWTLWTLVQIEHVYATQLNADIWLVPGIASPLSEGRLYLFQKDSNICVIKLSLPLHMRENGGSNFSPVTSTLWRELDIEHNTIFYCSCTVSMIQPS